MNAVSEADDLLKFADTSINECVTKNRVNEGNTNSSGFWSNIMYGTGMIAYLLLPPMIPGVTAHKLIVFNVGLVIFIYLFSFVAQAIKTIKLNKKRR